MPSRPHTHHQHRIRQLDLWTFPRSGIAFTWVLNREVAPQRKASR